MTIDYGLAGPATLDDTVIICGHVGSDGLDMESSQKWF
jgi:hypothetical protein